MAADCGGWEACATDVKDGTGGGMGEAIWVMDNTNWEGRMGGADNSFEITGSEAGIAGMPPYPGMPNGRGGGAESEGRPTTAAKRMEMSPIWRCMP